MEFFADFINTEPSLLSFSHTWATPLAEQRPGGGLIDGFRQTDESRQAEAEEKEAGMEVHSEDPSGFVLSASITAPFNVPQSHFIFFPPLLEVVMTILNSFHGEKVSPSHSAFIHWSDTVE